MKESLINWLNATDWNGLAEWVISHSNLLYLFPFPLIAFGAFFLFRILHIPMLLNALLSILITLCFGYLHKSNMTASPGEIDFQLIETVAIESIAGALLGLLAIFMLIIRSIYRKFKRKETVA